MVITDPQRLFIKRHMKSDRVIFCSARLAKTRIFHSGWFLLCPIDFSIKTLYRTHAMSQYLVFYQCWKFTFDLFEYMKSEVYF